MLKSHPWDIQTDSIEQIKHDFHYMSYKIKNLEEEYEDNYEDKVTNMIKEITTCSTNELNQPKIIISLRKKIKPRCKKGEMINRKRIFLDSIKEGKITVAAKIAKFGRKKTEGVIKGAGLPNRRGKYLRNSLIKYDDIRKFALEHEKVETCREFGINFSILRRIMKNIP